MRPPLPAARAVWALAITAALMGCSSRQPPLPGEPSAEAGAGEAIAPSDSSLGVEAQAPSAQRRPLPESVRLPPIPRLTGPPALHVEYPRRLQRIAVRDSNFLFGTTGTGDAQLWIDGQPVPVEANGAFLAWLPVPARKGSDTAEYLLIASGPSGSDTLRHRIRLPAEPFEGPPGTVWIDTASLPPQVERWMFPDEELEFSVRAAPGISVEVRTGEESRRLREIRPGVYQGGLTVDGLRMSTPTGRPCPGSAAPGVRTTCSGAPRLDTLAVEVVATDSRRRLVEALRYPIAILDSESPLLVELREEPDPIHGSSGLVAGSPMPGGTYRWLFASGARAVASGRLGDRVRIRLSPDLEAWVAAEDVEVASGSAPLTARVVAAEVIDRDDGVTAIRLLLDSPVPAHVEEIDPRTLRLFLFGALGESEPTTDGRGAGTGELEDLSRTQRDGGPYELTVRMRRPLWGYRHSYRASPEGRAELVLEIRSPPEVDPAEPLRGRRVAVDAGHPPGGAFGPTGLYEADANLEIAYRLAVLLEEAGAEPIMTRRDTLPLGLYDRTRRAISAGAELFVSIHNNALPDGTRPFGEEGTSTYYYYPHSWGLARRIQTGILATMRLQDLGTRWESFAVVRESWMPSVLAEGAFMMFPRQEAALRTREFRDAYARGLLWGIEEFLRDHTMEGEAGEE